MPRRPNSHTTTKWNITIPAELSGMAEALLYDPTTRRAKYGSKSELVTMLLRRWVEDQRTTPPLLTK